MKQKETHLNSLLTQEELLNHPFCVLFTRFYIISMVSTRDNLTSLHSANNLTSSQSDQHHIWRYYLNLHLCKSNILRELASVA